MTKAEHVGMSKKVLADALNRHLDVQACLIEGIIRRIDVNGDGVIDEDEVRQATIARIGSDTISQAHHTHMRTLHAIGTNKNPA